MIENLCVYSIVNYSIFFSLLFLSGLEGKKNISENRRAYKALYKKKRHAAAAVARLAAVNKQNESLEDDLPLGATDDFTTSNQVKLNQE